MSIKKKFLIWFIGFAITVVVVVVTIFIVVKKTTNDTNHQKYATTAQGKTGDTTDVISGGHTINAGANSMHGNIYSAGYRR